jgi:hypothetical protein
MVLSRDRLFTGPRTATALETNAYVGLTNRRDFDKTQTDAD